MPERLTPLRESSRVLQGEVVDLREVPEDIVDDGQSGYDIPINLAETVRTHFLEAYHSFSEEWEALWEEKFRLREHGNSTDSLRDHSAFRPRRHRPPIWVRRPEEPPVKPNPKAKAKSGSGTRSSGTNRGSGDVTPPGTVTTTKSPESGTKTKSPESGTTTVTTDPVPEETDADPEEGSPDDNTPGSEEDFNDDPLKPASESDHHRSAVPRFLQVFPVYGSGALVLITFLFLLLTSWTDPGIIPRRGVLALTPGLEQKILDDVGYIAPIPREPPPPPQPTQTLPVVPNQGAINRDHRSQASLPEEQLNRPSLDDGVPVSAISDIGAVGVQRVSSNLSTSGFQDAEEDEDEDGSPTGGPGGEPDSFASTSSAESTVDVDSQTGPPSSTRKSKSDDANLSSTTVTTNTGSTMSNNSLSPSVPPLPPQGVSTSRSSPGQATNIPGDRAASAALSTVTTTTQAAASQPLPALMRPQIPSLSVLQYRQGFRVCRTCEVVRPPRAAHCSDCNNCTLDLDHHCPFLNNCIGRRNYGFFWLFLCALTLLGISVLMGIGVWLESPRLHTISGFPVILGIIIGVPTGVLVLITAAFCVCHVYLICQGRTTREFLRGTEVASVGNSGRRESSGLGREGKGSVKCWCLFEHLM